MFDALLNNIKELADKWLNTLKSLQKGNDARKRLVSEKETLTNNINDITDDVKKFQSQTQPSFDKIKSDVDAIKSQLRPRNKRR